MTDNKWVPVTRWKEELLMWCVYIVGGLAIGTATAAVTLFILSLLGVEL